MRKGIIKSFLKSPEFDMDYYDEKMQMNARKSQWYDDVTRNLTKCPFCDLKSKYVIKELKHTVLCVNLFPYIDGHMLIIPKRHIEDFASISDDEWGEMKKLILIGANLVKNELKNDNTNVLYREGKDSGMSLKHVHIHILPVTPEFISYTKQKFVWQFQDIKFTPAYMAKRLSRACESMK